ncbi:uncharacterized protein CC84DRAFT_1213895 [Paraphaeosphaeria sporulosa]|uniref:RING-type domain-containing protein n=1 Tax=Paraphaeosphaeria sporulosa TaxID=1460663 RepID=A0A177CSS7_9PLEO|nr:uncharacterized protein CC84DRAFT_1213895 [Paraphaeosphaeria sporulosa]OAG10585.1 hypothetical protein CC84DRAFT_1213895 [Paraphaeosphaeria sporulosa]
MEETQHREKGIRFEAESLGDPITVLDAAEAEADSARCTASFRTLVHFIKFNVRYLPIDAGSLDGGCPICREKTSKSQEGMLQVDLPACKHIFGADCFERYIQRSYTCPMCREIWFEKRLTPETPSTQGRSGQVVIEVSITSDEAADSLLNALQNESGEMVRRLLGEQIAELDENEGMLSSSLQLLGMNLIPAVNLASFSQ